jgi:predicted nucleic acid-binding Zn ribbon protein
MSRTERVEKHCASCLKAIARGMYCSAECKRADAAALRVRLTPVKP